MKSLVVLVLFLVGSLYGEISFAKENAVSSENMSNLNYQNSYEKLVNKVILERKSLAEESKRQFEIIKYVFERERTAFENLIEKAIWLFGGVVTLVSFIIYRIYGDQKSLHQKITKDNQKKLEELEVTSNSLRDSMRTKLSELEELKEEVKKKEQEVSLFISEQNKYKSKNIVWVYGEEGIKDTSIISSLKLKDIKNVHEIQIREGIHFDKTQYQAIVFSIGNKENIDTNLDKFLFKLKGYGEPPLIVYTYNEGQQIRLSKEEWSILDKYDNYTVANFPGSLQTTLNNILRWL